MKSSDFRVNCCAFIALSFFLIFPFFQRLDAQDRVISGRVTHELSGEPMIGVNIIIQGTTRGETTDGDGYYSITVPQGYQYLQYSYLGMRTTRELIGESRQLDIQMEEDVFGLDEVVVSGVAAEMPLKKLPISIEVLNEDDLKAVPGTSISSGLSSKVAGFSVVSINGEPDLEQRLQIRGATSISSYERPMLIVDGIIMEGSLADISVNDIESVEILKGAASTSLYGSRAGAGVIVVHTKRGTNIHPGKTSVTFRTEYGWNSLARNVKQNEYHPFKLADDWQDETRFTKFAGYVYSDHPDSVGWPRSGVRELEDDQFADNPYMRLHDHQKDLYNGGNYGSIYLSVEGNAGRTNYSASFDRTVNQGIVIKNKGLTRNSVRVNLDHWFGDKLLLSTSSFALKSISHVVGTPPYQEVLMLEPDADLNAPNFDGTPFRKYPSPHTIRLMNPLYLQYYDESNTNINRFLGNYRFKYIPFKGFSIDAHYSIELNNLFYSSYWPKGKEYYQFNQGYLEKSEDHLTSQTFQLTTDLHNNFGPLFLKLKLSYLYEDLYREDYWAQSYEMSVKGVHSWDAVTGDVSQSSSITDIRSANFFGIIDADYKGKLIGSFLYRYDGSSLFGENERWNPYHRVSAAYRISEDLNIPGVSEMKIRASHGTSGIRPQFGAKDETYSISDGTVYKETLGNPDLKPAKIAEWEAGLTMDLFDRMNLDLVYSERHASDQIAEVPILVALTGFKTQWKNVGTLSSKTIEVSLGFNLVNTAAFKWRTRINGYRIRHEITELKIPEQFDFQTKIAVGSDPYIDYGHLFFTSLEDFREHYKDGLPASYFHDSLTVNDFVLNSEGYVIINGTEGTILEDPQSYRNAGGQEKLPIGDQNPEFQLGLMNTMNYKGISLYFLLDWRQGGDIYNYTRQFSGRDYRSDNYDQSGKPPDQKKSLPYYFTFYNNGALNSYFEEVGTYLKIREVSLSYDFSEKSLSGILKGGIKSLRISLIGRNLFTFTNYKGFDPETSYEAWNIFDSRLDYFSYPNFRSITGSLEIKF
jgi:TonB-linked SusC/RagA family outer membrane protein